MSILLSVFAFLFGTTIGSFLGVVVDRYREKTLGGRSECASCGKTLQWTELIPVLSYLVLRGRCSTCKAMIPIRVFLIELVCGALFVAIFLSIESLLMSHPVAFVGEGLYLIVMFSLLLVMSAYDLKHTIVPNPFVYSFAALAFVFLFVDVGSLSFHTPSLIDLLAGPLFFLPFFLLWHFSSGRWIGLGDGKLALGMGWFLGFSSGLSAIFLSFWIGAAVSVILLVIQKITQGRGVTAQENALTMKTEVPFAPFLAVGLVLVYFFEIHVLPF